MHPRFSSPVVVLALALAVVVGTVVLGTLGSAVSNSPSTSTTLLTSIIMRQMLTILGLSAIAGVLGWFLLFWLRRDGFHRMEWVALLPFNYGGRNPFDISK